MSNDWNTPTWLKKHFEGHFDPCPSNPNFNGLDIEWINPTFVNPPYNNPKEWVLKALRERGELILLCY